ncbi:thioredoxin family protein [Tenacibaculum finnmarkense]|uniref:thioredoxin family protein n=1 Tax=Tenacibaculum finnmarkense TaxID=2781243 RepID=UPI00187B639B|nr:thioredoxin family protein [Tenacibaculum finnmarkense]MBE7645719.1 thioredoxin fold domain-containing protein [Tenacibaculum finnmarkense genomovar ulcerans]MBE7647781.1 thioredoxin fold domain-containing protein [Tenacibaculum finnmarkense genomovar ulcerans]MCG8238591.1 thioredoxin family protein [Tenacibaculum finnmarkense genomovar ulcerans]MCG8775249.1 thioredoxin family protein [Tenacibaculum finnmarkense]MCG8785525.1 thioredoxin family protein [Tenacibaculum finnmarkense]
MNKIILVVTLLVVMFSVNAQVSDNKKLTWLTNVEQAQKIANEQNKQVFIYFSGSDWCIPCKELKEEVLDSEMFKKKAFSDYVLVNLDFLRSRRKLTKEHIAYIEKAAEKYNNSGAFPFVAVLNNKGEVVKSVDGYKSETASYYINNYLK